MTKFAIFLFVVTLSATAPALVKAGDAAMIGSSTKPAANAAGAVSPSGSGGGGMMKKHHAMKMKRGHQTGMTSGGNM